MKQIILALSVVLVGTAVMADEKSEKTLKVLLNNNQRIQKAENSLGDIYHHLELHDRKIENLAVGEGKLATRIAELERIAHGLQKQITILHAKKADK